MWNCPKCRSEVDTGFEVCWACGTSQDGREDPTFQKLLAEDGTAAAVETAPPVAAIAAEDRFVTIASFFSSGRAHVLRCLLEAEGIPVFLGEDSSFSGTLDTKVRVRECDQEKALRLLAELPLETTAEDEEKTVELPPVADAPGSPAAPVAPAKKAWWLGWLWRERPAPPVAHAPGSPAAPPEEPRQITAWEALRALESEFSNLMDARASKDWKVNPAFHPDVNAFIAKHANNSGFVQKARALQQNRAKYYAKMRELELAPKPPPEPEPAASDGQAAASAWTPSGPAGPPLGRRLLTGSLRLLRKLIKITVILLFVLAGLVLVASVGYRQYGKKQLEDAISETNKLDPNWQWASLLVNRKEVPDEENAALVVMKVAELLPEGFASDESSKVLAKIEEQTPTVALTEKQITLLRSQQEWCRSALNEGQALEGLTRGRYPDLEQSGPEKRKLIGHPECFWVNSLYRDESLLCAEDDDAAGALAACRIRINVARCFGDEPIDNGQLLRIIIVRGACRTLERVLGRTTSATDESLARTQRLLQDEMGQPVLRIMLRSQRAESFELLSQPDSPSGKEIEPDFLAELDQVARPVRQFLFAGAYLQERARYLRMMNEGVKLADFAVQLLPEETERYLAKHPHLGAVAMTLAVTSFQRHQTSLQLAIAGLALERYRLVHGRWPQSLDQLVPQFLAAIPLDPFDGKPLRLLRLESGLVVYSVGPDQTDDQGKVGPGNVGQSGTDIIFHLCDIRQRRQPPPKQ